MPAQNVAQINEQIENFKAVCTEIAEVQTKIFQLLEHEEVVTQNWNNLPDDFPSRIEPDAVGTAPPDQDDTVIGEHFSSNHIKKAKDAIELIRDLLQGTAVTVTGNPGRDIRRLTGGIV